jgi:glycosyltransferase involved in cell wall biosynthesis
LRILQISSAQTLGGGERHLADLANGLVCRGHDVYVALREGAALRKELTGICSENVFQLPLRNSLDVASARALSKIVHQHDIQIVHAHMGRDYPLAAFAVRNSAACLVITRHVMFPLSRLHKFTLGAAARVIAVSSAVANQLKTGELVDPAKITVVLNGIDVEKFRVARLSFNRRQFLEQWKFPSDCLLVGTVGELTALKGHLEFLEAAAHIAQQLPQTYFIVAGIDYSQNGSYGAQVEAAIRKLDLEERVRMVGWVADLPQLYCGVDVFVSTSKSESFGLAIAEAMASSAAIVATATDGARELIVSGETGLLVPVDDVQTIAETVIRLLTDDKQRVLLGSNAQATAQKTFSLDRMISDTEQIYREVVG